MNEDLNPDSPLSEDTLGVSAPPQIHSCHIIRSRDFLNVKMYFVNLTLSRNGTKLEKKSSENSYLVVRLPQQHRAESHFNRTSSGVGDTAGALTSKSVISGFSWLTFRVNKSVPFNVKALLDWSKFELVTLQQMPEDPKRFPVEIDEKTAYPPDPEKNLMAQFAIEKIGDFNVPVTFFEVPYKMFLSPIHPSLRPNINTDHRVEFRHNNQVVEYADKYVNNEKVTLSELWNNDLAFKVTGPANGSSFFPPNFKITGYASIDPFDTLPTGTHRKKLAELTNAPEPLRDLLSKYFNISSLGASTYLHYFNLNDKVNGENKEVVGYKHEIKLGADNYVEVTVKAVDLRSSLKVLASDIVERRIENGRSILVSRKYFEYLEREKTFPSGYKFGNYVFTKIIARSKGAFFSPQNLITDGFVLYSETESTRILKLPYTGIDAKGQEINFEMDVALLLESAFKHFDTMNTALNKRIAETHREEHRVTFDKVRIAYAPSIKSEREDLEARQNNNEMITTEMQFYATLADADFNSEFPVAPNLKYARVQIPQLEGIQDVPELYFVNLAETYIKSRLDPNSNKTGVFLRVLAKEVETKALTKSLPDAALAEFKDQNLISRISGVFSENYRNIGSVINPDITIENISVLDQGLTLTDELNSRLDNIRNVNPADLLRGMDAEILGGVDLKKILKTVIPIEDTPVFRIIDEAQDGLKGIPDFVEEYERDARAVTDLKQTIEAEQRKLADSFNDEFKSYIDKLTDKVSRIREVALELGQQLDAEAGELIDDPSLKVDGKIILASLREKVDEVHAGLLSKVTTLPAAHPVRATLDKFTVPLKPNLKIFIAVKQLLSLITLEIEKYALGSTLGRTPAQEKRLQLYGRFRRLIQEVGLKNQLLQVATNTFIADLKTHVPDLRTFASTDREIALTMCVARVKEFIKTGQPVRLPDFLLNYREGEHTLQHLLQQNGLITDASFTLTDDLSAWSEVIESRASELGEYYEIQFEVGKRAIEHSVKVAEQELLRMREELFILKGQVSHNIRKKFIEMGVDNYARFCDVIQVRQLYPFIQKLYTDYQQIRDQAAAFKRQYNNLVDDTTVASLNTSLEPLQGSLKNVLFYQSEVLSASLDEAVRKQLGTLNVTLRAVPFQEAKTFLSTVSSLDHTLQDKVNRMYLVIDKERQEILNRIGQLKSELVASERVIKNFIRDKLSETENRLRNANAELIKAYEEGEEAVERVRQDIDNIQDTIKRILSVSKKEYSYKWRTDQFDDVPLGILTFLKGKQAKTELTVEVNSTLKYDLLQFPPKIKGIETYSHNKLSNFTLSFLNLISVEFDNVTFTGGSGRKEKVDILIRDVRFEGPLNFVAVFQKYLKTIDKGLTLDVSAAGARLGYMLPLPDISGGAFNFSNAKLSMELILPFRPRVPMRFNFGLNSMGDMFLVTAGIFGGRGCFQIGIEPKHGVVMVQLVIEFGGVLYLNIGVAKGIVYLFAGIYIKRVYDRVELNGYLTCGGALDVLGIITASVTFYLGLRGTGKYMEGYCTITYKIKISVFIEFKVRLSMYKRIYGTTDNSRVPSGNGTSGGAELAIASEADNQDLNEVQPISDADWKQLFEACYHNYYKK